MGIALIFLAVSIVLLVLGFYLASTDSEISGGIGIVAIVIGVVCIIFSGSFMIFTGIDVASKGVSTQKLECSKAKMSRLLNEDYNAENLKNALDFNESQKMCVYKEATFMWSHFGTNGVCVDTIAIPTGKFIPRQIIQLDSLH